MSDVSQTLFLLATCWSRTQDEEEKIRVLTHSGSVMTTKGSLAFFSIFRASGIGHDSFQQLPGFLSKNKTATETKDGG